jgi:hypothetical protein
MIEVVTKFLGGSTVWARAYVTDMMTGLAPSPDVTSVKITIKNPAGTVKVNDIAMTENEGDSTTDATVYDYYYTPVLAEGETSLAGHWPIVVWVTDGTGDTAKKSAGAFSFEMYG